MRAMWLVLCAAVVVAASGAAPAGAPAAAPVVTTLDNLLPDDAVLYVSIRNVPEALEKVKLTAGYKIFDQLKLIERLAPPDKYAEMQKVYGTYIEPLGAICRGEVALVVFSFDVTEGGRPELAFLIDVSRSENALNDYLEKTLFPLLDEQGIKPEAQDVAGVKVTTIIPPGEDSEAVLYAVKDGVLIVSPRLDTLSSLLANIGPGPSRAMLPSNVSYANVRKAVGASDLTVYVNLGKFVQDAIEKNAEAATWLPVFGFDKLSAVGFGTKLGADGSGTTVVRLVTTGEPVGWLGMMAQPGGTFKSLKRVPSSTGLYMAANMGSPEEIYERFGEMMKVASETTGGPQYEEFTAGLEQIEVALGMSLTEDVLPAFGGEMAMAVRVPEAVGIPPAAILLEVKDKEKAQVFVDRVLELVQTFGGDGGVRVMTAQYNGVDIDTIIAAPMISPAVALLDDFLVIGTSAETLRTIIDAGADGKTIEQRPDFVATMAGLPKTGTEVFYLDLREVYEFAFPIVASQIPAGGRGAELVTELGGIGQHLGGVGVMVSGDAGGLTYTAYSQKALLEPLMLGSAAVVLPAFSSARETARQTASMQNVKQLCTALQLYRVNNNEMFPETLGDLAPYVGSASVFIHPENNPEKKALINLDEPETINEHSDYELVITSGSFDDIVNPSETITIREKQVFSRKGRVVGFADGHVKVIPETPQAVPVEIEVDSEWGEDE
ncbi:MAG: DUF3352 domain-containing protein [Verrucomicrobia bacterium]|nr:DUF3352 domain-containing protein [Verrucomicrobiota bacterium]